MRADPRSRSVRGRGPALGLTLSFVLSASVVLSTGGCGGDLNERTIQAGEDLQESGARSMVPTPEGLMSTAPGSGDAERPGGGTQEIYDGNLGFTWGDPDAPIKVIEFSDFGCGYCRRFHQEAYPALFEEYVETGKIEWTYVPFVLGIFPNGLEAALAGECAGEQGMFEPYAERLFADQPDWKQSSAPNELFRRYAREEGLDADRFGQCLHEDWRRDRVRAGVIAGAQLGIRGTPTFFIPGYPPLQGALPQDVFRQVFNIVLADLESQ